MRGPTKETIQNLWQEDRVEDGVRAVDRAEDGRVAEAALAALVGAVGAAEERRDQRRPRSSRRRKPESRFRA